MKRDRLLLALVVALLIVSSLACSVCQSFEFTEDQRSEEENSAMGLDSVYRGSISVGGQVTDELNDLSLAHDWSFEGRAGQTVNIRCEAAPGDDTDPRVNLVGPGGDWLAADDDGGGGYDAQISNYRLPSDGTYTIKVDVFAFGEYILTVE